jgi:hypothetical protein
MTATYKTIMDKEKHVVIIDQIGRNIIGNLVGETDTTLTLHNPVIVFIQPEQSGQIQVQSFPVFFFEFINKEFRGQNNWTYQKANITTSDVVLDERILAQYEKINTPPLEPQVISSASPKVVSINSL